MWLIDMEKNHYKENNRFRNYNDYVKRKKYRNLLKL